MSATLISTPETESLQDRGLRSLSLTLELRDGSEQDLDAELDPELHVIYFGSYSVDRSDLASFIARVYDARILAQREGGRA